MNPKLRYLLASYGLAAALPNWNELNQPAKPVSKIRTLEHNLSKGLTLFEIDGIKVWALNKKNAIRKINKLKSL